VTTYSTKLIEVALAERASSPLAIATYRCNELSLEERAVLPMEAGLVPACY
jgi:hypothetical protein